MLSLAKLKYMVYECQSSTSISEGNDSGRRTSLVGRQPHARLSACFACSLKEFVASYHQNWLLLTSHRLHGQWNGVFDGSSRQVSSLSSYVSSRIFVFWRSARHWPAWPVSELCFLGYPEVIIFREACVACYYSSGASVRLMLYRFIFQSAS